MNSITRRLALTGIAATAAAPALSHTHTSIGDLWEQRQALVDSATDAMTRYDAALTTIPEWATPGPRNINSAGEFCGQHTGAPLDIAIKAPEPDRAGVYRVCRVSFDDVRERFEFNTSLFPRNRAVYRAHMRERLRKLIPLYRAQAAEYRRAGIREIESEQEALFDARWQIEQAIYDCPPSHQRTAACIMIAMVRFGGAQDSADSDASMAVAVPALVALQPHLTGLLAEHVVFVLQDDGRPLGLMPFWGA